MLEWAQIQPFGAELNIDLSCPLMPDDVDEFRDVFATEHPIVAPGQSLTKGDQERLTSYFGPLLSGDDAVEVVSNDPSKGLFGDHRLAMHSDLAFCAEPSLIGALYPIDINPGESATKFASGARAYAELSPDLRERINDFEVLNVLPVDQTQRNRLVDLQPEDPRAVHRLVMSDERSGQAFLYLCEMQVDSIVGLNEHESEDMLTRLFEVMLHPDNILTHAWMYGDVVLWDNLAVQHGRDDISHAGPRTLRRTTAARVGFRAQYRHLFTFDETGNLAKVLSAQPERQ